MLVRAASSGFVRVRARCAPVVRSYGFQRANDYGHLIDALRDQPIRSVDDMIRAARRERHEEVS